MPHPTGNPRIDEVVQRIEERIGSPVACPCCRGADWETATDFVRVVVVTEADPDAGGKEGAGSTENLRTIVFVCDRCGFVRSHLIAED